MIEVGKNLGRQWVELSDRQLSKIRAIKAYFLQNLKNILGSADDFLKNPEFLPCSK